ncbi:hypothetical protein E6O75_ATG01644 [Venturia nashicola]|uniref:AA1-like domain-containing protein n=1 Tax=Venturia nashicola TaxID=86259 RepID=A0A4Z1P0G2_9PEZI|nr:hypothetical protein E6O75_ATG01644 [Venturia nashicola]
MQFTTALVTLATLASISSAAPAPAAAPQAPAFTGTSKWLYWTVTDLSITSSPTAPKEQFKFTIQYKGQSTKTTCTGPAEAIKCLDASFTINADQGRTEFHTFNVSQKLYQSGAIAVLKGSTNLTTQCLISDGVTPETTNTVCRAKEFKIDAELAKTVTS